MLQRLLSKRLYRDLLFFGLLLLVSFVYDYHSILFERPQGLHVWRQTDCLSLAYHYYKEDAPFLEPEMHIQFSDGQTSGKTLGEFPIIYYTVGVLWKIFGHHEFIYRLLLVLISYLGLYYLYRLTYGLTQSWFWSSATALLLFTSPIYAHYTNNFLTNAPAFSVMLIAWYFFYRYYKSGRMKFFYVALLLFTLTGLLKISSLLSFAVLMAVFGAELVWLIRFRSEGKIFPRPVLQGLLLLAVPVLVMAWYKYADHYMSIHLGRYTFTEPVPVWSAPDAAVTDAFKSFKEFVIHQLHSFPVILYCLAAAVFLYFRWRRVHRFWLFSIPLMLAGYVFFVMLFYYSMNGHDYYHVDFLAVLLLMHLGFVHYICRYELSFARAPLTLVFASLFFVYAVMGCASNLRIRYKGCPGAEMAYRQLFATKMEIDLFNYHYWQITVKEPYGTIEPELRKAGIRRTDRVISMDDGSFNATLYLMDQKGWTNMDWQLNDSARIAEKISLGAKYLIADDHGNFEKPYIRPFLGHKLFQYKNIHVFDLRPYAAAVK